MEIVPPYGYGGAIKTRMTYKQKQNWKIVEVAEQKNYSRHTETFDARQLSCAVTRSSTFDFL